MTGNFSCEFERTVSLVSHIVETIRHCIRHKSDRERDQDQKVTDLKNGDFHGSVTAATMIQFRRYIWGCLLESSSKGEFEWKCSYIFQHSVHMGRVMPEIENMPTYAATYESSEDELKWFSSFILAMNFLFIEVYSIHCRLKGREVPHKAIRQTILTSMSDHLLPFSSLITMLCQGDINKSCSLCQEPTTITAWLPSYLGFLEAPEGEQSKPCPNNLLQWAESAVLGKAFVYLDIYGFTLYCCTQSRCLKKVFVLIRVTRARENEQFARSENYANSSHCAYCFKQCSGRPRCGGCKAKVYCSKECKDTDWEVHEMFCEALAKEKRRYRSKREIDQTMQERTETQDDLVKNCSKVTEIFKAVYDGVCNDDNATVAEIGKAVVDKLVLDTEVEKNGVEAEVD